jgi:hypothetical protein
MIRATSLGFLPLLSFAALWPLHGDATNGSTIPASDPTFLGSVLDETWDVRHAAAGYIDCMMPASDVDLAVAISTPGAITLRFDTSVYPPGQSAGAGPRWMAEVDGKPDTNLVTMGPGIGVISTPPLEVGKHRVRFMNIGNPSGGPRWAATAPQLSRVTGVTLPAGAALEKSPRPAAWFLPIADSIGEGYHDMNTTRSREGPGAYTDVYNAWPVRAAQLLNLSVGGELISGIGVVHAGTGVPYGALNAGDPTGANDGWDHIFAGVPRPFTTAPKFILLEVGSNEAATDARFPGHAANVDPSSSDANFQANLVTFIERVRTRPQLARTPILLGVPFGGFKRTPIQGAVAAYRAAHPGEANLCVFDLAYGSPALATTAAIDEIALFNGSTKNRADDADTIPSPQAPDRTHPYAVATPAIGSVDAHAQLARIFAARLAALLHGGPAPATGNLRAGGVRLKREGTTVMITAARATGGSAPYTYQFERSTDGGATWAKLGATIDNQASTIKPIAVTDIAPESGATYRVTVSDTAEPSAVAHSSAAPTDARSEREGHTEIKLQNGSPEKSAADFLTP